MKKLIPHIFKLLSVIAPKLAALWALKLFSHPRRKPRSDKEMEFLKTGKAVTFNSKRVAYIWGENKHPVIWLLHGWESQGSTFYKLIPLLLKKGYQVIAWDGPAHGASPGDKTNVAYHAKALFTDMSENRFTEPQAILGHSFGGAVLAVLSKLQNMPNKTVIVSAPSRIQGVFERFCKMIRLGKKAQYYFIELSEKNTGYSLAEVSLIHNDISRLSDVMVIHDKGDDVIPYDEFCVLKESWQSGQFVSTENLGHRLTIKDKKMLEMIVGFITN
jgi:esterase/lipase